MRFLFALVPLLACHRDAADDGDDDDEGPPIETYTPVPTGPTTDSATLVTSGDPPLLRFASIGDYGSATVNEQAVADLVDRLRPDFVVTVGDNSYSSIPDAQDDRIGQYYHQWMYPYSGDYGAGSPDQQNRFWPAMGNHDWDASLETWESYFTLPENERYWTRDVGVDPVSGDPLLQLVFVDSDFREPDGNTATSVQGQYIQAAVAASSARWNVVVFHHPPWSSGTHGNNRHLQWPWAAWGIDSVLTGHDHMYERQVRDGEPFVTDGRGGASLYAAVAHGSLSQVAMYTGFGATAVDVRDDSLTVQAYDTSNRLVDSFRILHDRPLGVDTRLVRLGSSWRYDDTGVDRGTSWRDADFDDSSWASGWGQLGFGDTDEATTLSPVYHPTVYFRTTFQVAESAAFPQLAVDLVRDDGAAIYLNGVEVARSNMPEGELAFDTLASVPLVLPADEDALVTLPFDNRALVAGTNVLAVEVHQATDTSTDLSFDLALREVHGSRLVHANELDWQYRDSGVAPPADWRTTTGTDGWSVGPAPLGWGHDDLATVVDEGDPLQQNATTWFRRAFTVDDPTAFTALWLRAIRDDGYVVYLNGVEASRSNVALGPLGPGTYAVSEVPDGWESAWTETFVDPTLLHAGENVVAVEVHEALPAGRNLRFDLELEGLK